MTTERAIEILRELYVTADDKDIKEAIDQAYDALLKLHIVKAKLNEVFGCFGGRKTIEHYLKAKELNDSYDNILSLT